MGKCTILIPRKNLSTDEDRGLMSPEGHTKLAGIEAKANNYIHPANHPATVVTQDITHRFVTDAEKSTWNGKAPGSHTHPKSQITDFPGSLKNPYGLTIKTNGTSQGAYDGNVAKEVNITPANVGAAASGHNHDSVYVKGIHRTLTLTAAGWSSSYPYTQRVNVSGVTANNDIKVIGVYAPSGATQEQVKVWTKEAGYLMYNPDGVAAGSITFKAYRKPTVNFQILTEGG